MACADQLDVISETSRNCLGPICVALDGLNDLVHFLLLIPCMEGFQVIEYQGVAVVHVTGAIRTSLRAPRCAILDGSSRGRGGSESKGYGRGSCRDRVVWGLRGLKRNGMESEILKTHRISRKSGSLWRGCPSRASRALLFGRKLRVASGRLTPSRGQHVNMCLGILANTMQVTIRRRRYHKPLQQVRNAGS
jgi:hypothetical protein